MKEIILKIFSLQDLDRRLKECRVEERAILLEFEDSSQAWCPGCGTKTRHRHARGKWRRVYHGAGYGRQVWLIIRLSRYFCPNCRRLFTERTKIIPFRQRRTLDAEKSILDLLRGRSFKSLADREGISYGISKRTLERRLDPERITWPEQGEISLGIDAHSFRGTRMVNTITDVRARRPLTVLPDNRQETIRRFLREIPGEVKPRIGEVCIDMETMLLMAAAKELPEVPVVVDHFHVIQDANRRVDEARKIEQDAARREIPRKLFLVGEEKLSPREKSRVAAYGKEYPSLKEFYWMKEQLRRFYRFRSKKAAVRKLKDLIEIAFLSDDAAMVQWGRSLQRWGPQILNYFDRRTTNAYTEGIHTKIKMIKRVSFGFRNVQVYVRKILLCILPLSLLLPCLPH